MENIVPIALDLAIKSSLILGLAWLITLLMRRGSAASRHLVWTLAVVSVLALPGLAYLLPGLAILPAAPRLTWVELSPASEPAADRAADPPGVASADPAYVDPPADASPMHDAAHEAWPLASGGGAEAGEAGVEGPAPLPDAPSTTAPANDAQATAPSWPSLLWPWLPWVWLGGMSFALLPLVLGWMSLLHLRRTARPITRGPWQTLLHELAHRIGLKRNVVLLKSPCRTMPMTWGGSPWTPAKVLMPEDACDWSADRQRAVLLHELGHVKRRDCLTQMLSQVACAIYWFNPLIWLAAHRMLIEREQACDDMVLLHETDSADYAQHLLDIATGPQAGLFTAHAGIAMARRSKLDGRLVAILDKHRNRRAMSRLGVALTITLIGAVAVPVAMLQAEEAQPDDNTLLNTGSSTVAAEPRLAEVNRVAVQFEVSVLLVPSAAIEQLGLPEEHTLPVTQLETSDDSDLRLVGIDDLQADLLRRAAHGARNGHRLDFPTARQWSGRSIPLRRVHYERYTASYTTTDNSDSEFEPARKTAASGVELDLTGGVQSERQIKLTLHPTIDTITGATRQVAWPDSPAERTLRIDQPQRSTWSAEVVTTLPNKGTLLMVGPELRGKLTRDEPGEAAELTRRLLILVKSTVIEVAQPQLQDGSSDGEREPGHETAGEVVVQGEGEHSSTEAEQAVASAAERFLQAVRERDVQYLRAETRWDTWGRGWDHALEGAHEEIDFSQWRIGEVYTENDWAIVAVRIGAPGAAWEDAAIWLQRLDGQWRVRKLDDVGDNLREALHRVRERVEEQEAYGEPGEATGGHQPTISPAAMLTALKAQFAALLQAVQDEDVERAKQILEPTMAEVDRLVQAMEGSPAEAGIRSAVGVLEQAQQSLNERDLAQARMLLEGLNAVGPQLERMVQEATPLASEPTGAELLRRMVGRWRVDASASQGQGNVRLLEIRPDGSTTRYEGGDSADDPGVRIFEDRIVPNGPNRITLTDAQRQRSGQSLAVRFEGAQMIISASSMRIVFDRLPAPADSLGTWRTRRTSQQPPQTMTFHANGTYQLVNDGEDEVHHGIYQLDSNQITMETAEDGAHTFQVERRDDILIFRREGRFIGTADRVTSNQARPNGGNDSSLHPMFRIAGVADNTGVDLDAGHRQDILRDWPDAFDVLWEHGDHDGQVLGMYAQREVRMLALPDAADFEQAIAQAVYRVDELQASPLRAVFDDLPPEAPHGEQARFAAALTSEGRVAVVDQSRIDEGIIYWSLGTIERDGGDDDARFVPHLERMGEREAAFDRFWPHGEFAGVALGDDRKTVLERWGEPRDTSTSRGRRIRTDSYPPDRRLLYHNDQLVQIRIGRVGRFETRFDNGFDGNMTREQVITALGPPDESSQRRISYRNGDRMLVVSFSEEGIPAIHVSDTSSLGNLAPDSPHGARMRLPQGELSYERFSRGGVAGPIALGDPMAEVVAHVGEPGDVLSMHGGRDWIHYYDNGTLEYRHGQLTSITLRLYGENGFSFDNGLTGETTMEQAKVILDPDAEAVRSSGPRGSLSFVGEQHNVSAYFMREGQFFPDNEEEARTAPLTKLSVQRRVGDEQAADQAEASPPVTADWAPKPGQAWPERANIEEAWQRFVDALLQADETAMRDLSVSSSPSYDVRWSEVLRSFSDDLRERYVGQEENLREIESLAHNWGFAAIKLAAPAQGEGAVIKFVHDGKRWLLYEMMPDGWPRDDVDAWVSNDALLYWRWRSSLVQRAEEPAGDSPAAIHPADEQADLARGLRRVEALSPKAVSLARALEERKWQAARDALPAVVAALRPIRQRTRGTSAEAATHLLAEGIEQVSDGLAADDLEEARQAFEPSRVENRLRLLRNTIRLQIMDQAALRQLAAQPMSNGMDRLFNYTDDPDLALAMTYDSEYNAGDHSIASQTLAEKHYLRYLQRAEDSEQRARIYAQLGVLFTTNVHREQGERPDYEKARRYFAKVLEEEPVRVGKATIRARLMTSTPEETSAERRARFVRNVRWLEGVLASDLRELYLPPAPGVEPDEGDLRSLRSLLENVQSATETNLGAIRAGQTHFELRAQNARATNFV